MSIKSLIQIIILILIFIILGSVYFKYFSNNNYIVEENSEIIEEKALEIVKEKVSEIVEEKDPKIIKEKASEIVEEKASEIVEEKDPKIIKEKASETVEEKASETVEEEVSKKVKENIEVNENKVKKKENKPKKIQKVKNLVKDVEYLTTDKKGNRYRILATSGKSNLNDNSILDLDNVRGVITSADRSNIYIVSDFAEYNSTNLSSKFYQNVVINYEDKEIICDNFDINMETNMAVAYNNVVVTDPKSIMNAGEITLDIETKDININPESNKTKVEVITN